MRCTCLDGRLLGVAIQLPPTRADVDRTALLATVSSRLAEVVILLTAAGEERLAAYAEDLAQQVEVSALEDKAPPQSAPH
jgi:hypothetical protein